MAVGHLPEVSPGTSFVFEIPSLKLVFSVFADDLVDYVENSKKFTKNLLKLIREFSKLIQCRANIKINCISNTKREKLEQSNHTVNDNIRKHESLRKYFLKYG